jgi:hypothetical protein
MNLTPYGPHKMAYSVTSLDALIAPTSRAQHTTLSIMSRLSSLTLPDDSDMVALPLHHGVHYINIARLTMGNGWYID